MVGALVTKRWMFSYYSTYPNPPNFRSGLHQYTNPQNKQDFMAIQAALIKATLTSSKPFTTASHEPSWNTSSVPLWWLLVHFEMLILAPKLPDDNSATSINIRITTLLKLFHMGQIKTLWEEAMSIASRKKSTAHPPTGRNDDRAVQHAADHDNWRTENARLSKTQMLAPISADNFGSVCNLYSKKYDLPPPKPSFSSVPYYSSKIHHIPGNISKSIFK